MKFKSDLNEVIENIREAYEAHVERDFEENEYDDIDDTAAKMFIIPKIFDSTEN